MAGERHRAGGTARARRAMVGGALAAVLALIPAVALAGSSVPGTASQVHHAVAVSHSITKVDAAVAAELSGPSDIPQRLYPVIANGCNTVTQCVFGDVASHHVIVLFGDSHAMMWLPALNPAARKDGDRLVLLWTPACPAADVSGYRYVEEVVPTNAQCAAWRQKAITAIQKLRPAAVLVGERTAAIVHASTGQPFTAAQWFTGLAVTVAALLKATPHVGVLEDIVFFDGSVPNCLAAYPNQVQRCSVKDPNPRFPGQQVAEQAVAKATGATFVKTNQWFCTARCSPIIGNFIVYYNEGHVSAHYAEYLAAVMRTAIAPLL